MGLFDVLSGGHAAGRIKEGTFLHVDHINKGREQAEGHLRDGLGEYFKHTDTGRNESRNYLDDGFSHARDAATFHATGAHQGLINQNQKARDAYSAGSGQAQGYLDSALSRVNDLYQPYIEQGNQASGLYSDLIGLNGGDAAVDAYSNMYDPSRDFRNEQITRAMDARASAAGSVGGGRADLATARALNESQYSDMQNYANRLERASQTGGQYASNLAGLSSSLMGQKANVAQQEGAGLAQYHNGLGQNLADLGMQQGQYIANTHMAQAMPQAQYSTAHYNNLGNQTYNTEANLGSLDWTAENSIGSLYNQMHRDIASAKAAGASNLVGLGTSLFKGATGGLFG